MDKRRKGRDHTWTAREADYEALKRVGHSPAKAVEIVLDAERGDRHAREWIKAVREAESLPRMKAADAFVDAVVAFATKSAT